MSINMISPNQFIIVLIKMSGLKNLMPRGIFAESNYSILKKKSQDFKRSINAFVEHLQLVNRIYENYYGVFENNLADLVTFFPHDQDNGPKFFKEIVAIFKSLNKELRNFIEKQSNNQKPILQLSDLFMNDYNVLVQNFQENCKEYMGKQQNLVESCEAYFKMYKQMMSNIQAYKYSFMDVKIIYNKDEKIKRYNECVYTYKNLEEDHAIINKKVEELNKDKLTLVDRYQILERQLTNFTSSFATRYIDELKKFAECLFELERGKLQIIMDKLQQIDKILPINFMVSNINVRFQESIQGEVKLGECQFLPCCVFYSDNIKEEAKPIFKKMVVIYFQQLSQRIEKRKVLDRKIVEYMQKFLRALDKNLMDSYRDTLQSFDKIRKKIGEVFGSRWLSFYKIISSLFQNSIENTGRLMKRVENKLKSIEGTILEEALLYDSFLKEFKNYIDKCISKKIFKKYTLGSEERNEALLQEELTTSRAEIHDISTVLRRQITKANENILKFDNNLKILYVSFLNDVKSSISEFYSFCNEISRDYYREDIYFKNYQLCQDEIVISVKKEMKFFEEIQFAALVKENNKITFEGEFNKIQGFKKIKKPKELEGNIRENEKNQTIHFENARETEILEIGRNSKFNSNGEETPSPKLAQKQIFIGESSSRYAEYLSTRIQFESNEKFIKSCSCALSDKIILAGRMFITTHRLFFYSKFNRSNLFFGETFIEVPKCDIKKIEKKASSLFINNAISITTVNGELFFISFMTRDKIFDILKDTFQVNSEEIFFEEEQGEAEDEKEDQLEFEDDMKPELSLAREQSILKQLGQYKYAPVFTGEFQIFGLNPIKFLKMFELDQEVNINRTSFLSFTHFLKDLAEHKEMSVEQWSPNPLDYLNTANIKEITPEVFTRKVAAIVPLPNSGIPFMPKTSYTTEEQTLYILNKDKFIIELIVKSQGVPYCDTFDIRMKKTVQRSDEHKVKMFVEIFVNFNQNVMVKSTIESKAMQSTKQSFEKAGSEIKSYLKILEKKMMKNTKKQTPEDKIAEQAQLIQQLEIEIKTLKDEKKQSEVKFEQLKIQFKYCKIGLLVLGIMAIIQLLFILG